MDSDTLIFSLDGKSFTGTRYSDYQFVATDPKEFRVSNYGIPEPVGVEWPKPIPNYVWFLIAAGAFGVLMIGFRYFARRRTRNVPT